MEKIKEKKMHTPIDVLWKNHPQSAEHLLFKDFLQYIFDLRDDKQFETKQDYAYLRGIFEQILKLKN